MNTADRVRGRIGAAIFERVAGPNGRERRALIQEPGERMFAGDRPIRRVHGDSAMCTQVSRRGSDAAYGLPSGAVPVTRSWMARTRSIACSASLVRPNVVTARK